MSQRTMEPDLIAAPPDDGGDLGVFSRPQDATELRNAQRPSATEDRHPALSSDPTRTGHIPVRSPAVHIGVAFGTVLLIALTIALVALAMVVSGG